MKLKRLLKKTIAKVIKSKTVHLDGLTVKGACEDYGLLKAISDGAHEEYFKRLFLGEVKPGMTVVDIGAHLGKYSLLAGKQVGEQGKVFSFEPHPRTYSYLESNISANHLAKRITPFRCAVSKEDGTSQLQADLVQSDFTSLVAVRDQSEVQTIETPTRKLSSAVPGILPDVYKIDVEGAECLVLEGIEEALAKARASGKQPTMFIEANSEALQAFSVSPKSLYEKLQSLGFQSIQTVDESEQCLRPPQLNAAAMCENWICH